MTQLTVDHARLAGLVAAFADGELAGATRREVEEHLGTCGRCRNELRLQQGLSRALAQEPIPAAPPLLRLRIEWLGEPKKRRAFALRRDWLWAAAAVIAGAIYAGTAARTLRHDGQTPLAQIPVLRDAVADCRRATARNFPRAVDLPAVAEGLRFPIRALYRPEMQLFSTWKTTLAGSPAAGLAYRWRGIVVVQYTVAPDLIRGQPEVGEAVASAGFYARSELGQGMVAILEDGSGTVLIADVPPEELRRLVL